MKPATSMVPFGPRTGSRRRAQGVALVVTLILLSVITFMAIAFLVISRSQRGSVSTSTDMVVARLAADAALEQAKADMIIPIMAENNPFAVDLMVSTNYINTYGFIPGYENATNVNFDYTDTGAALSSADQQVNLANLQFRPRVPVYMKDRAPGPTLFQYYLDINRNGRFEPTGFTIVTNSFNVPQLDTNNVVETADVTGDPQWIGGLEFPERRHSPTNRFTWRFAYVVAPVGNTLDLNYIHNDGRFLPINVEGNNGFVRNQGVGTWEINMGAFLTDLNTNMWFNSSAVENGWGHGYTYNTDLGAANIGAGFDDATALLRYRYDNDYRTLWTPQVLFGNVGRSALMFDGYDSYGSGDNAAPSDPDSLRINEPWPGSYNTNLFYSPYDLFDRKKAAIGVTGWSLTDRLEEAAKRPSTYDRYTFSRLLSQMGTESAPETDKINVNYRNMENGRFIANYETNFYPWAAIDFFTNAAPRLLNNAGFAFGITNIQVWPTNNYTPSVHRALQMAANLYDATTNNPNPTVFRPLFERRTVGGTNAIYIAGYERVNNIANLTGKVWRDLEDPTDRAAIVPDDLVWGVPFIVGAKKDLPNFNEFAMDTKLQITRKLEFRRSGGNEGPVTETNQMFTFSIVNGRGLEAWNSYLHTNGMNLAINARVEVNPWMTNRFGQVIYSIGAATNLAVGTNFTIGLGNWRGFTTASATEGSVLPVIRDSSILLPASTYLEGARRFLTPVTGQFERTGRFPITDWHVNVRTRLFYNVVNTDTGEILDFVTLADFYSMDLADILQRSSSQDTAGCGIAYRPYVPSADAGAMWCTNRFNNSLSDTVPTEGILNQIAVCMGLPAQQWPTRTNSAGINFFRAQFGFGNLPGTTGHFSKTNTFYAPYSPTREVYLFVKWQANDPLVHYTPGDLFDQGNPRRWDFGTNYSNLRNVGKINGRYEPYVKGTDSTSPTAHDISLKDPLVFRSDDWDFPTNKLPNVGWLGRVHRGTPWQTVYLKSSKVDAKLWAKWAGSEITFTNHGEVKYSVVASNSVANDSTMSMPFQDWAIPDIFTATLVDNASRGQLSINQKEIAAWSAVLSGVPVLSNATVNASGQFTEVTNIQPAAVDGVLDTIVQGINRTRSQLPGGVFRRLGEICSVPELTVKSPYIHNPGRVGDIRLDRVSDEVYERIPQQVLGLLRCDTTPRFVVYCYGQALKPATASLLTSGPLAGMCTNYQVTAEVATRAVVRVDGAPEHPRVVVENFNVLNPD